MCNTCADCDSSQLTLPTGQQGQTGAAGTPGAAGDPGTNGTNGVALLHNDLTASTNTTVAVNSFANAKLYNMPANTMVANGDSVTLTGLMDISEAAASGDAFSNVTLFINGSIYQNQVNVGAWGGEIEGGVNFMYTVKLDRISATTVRVSTVCHVSNAAAGVTLRTYAFNSADVTVPSLTTTVLPLEFRGGTNTGALNCNKFSVELSKI